MQPDDEEPTFGAELRRRRLQAGLSLHQLALLVSYTKGHLSRVEKAQKQASEQFARACDTALNADGALFALAAASGSGDCPYPGPTAFGAEDARWFFGRDRDTANLLGLLADPSTAGHPALVVGPSGVGKSSLLKAGLTPAVLRGGLPARRPGSPQVLYLTPTGRPMDELRRHQAAQPLDSYTLVIVDQFEELFTLCTDGADREDFIRRLFRLAADGLPMAIGVRADFHKRCLPHPLFLAALRARSLLLRPLSAQELRQVIVEPATAAGLDLEPGLPMILLRDLGVVPHASEDGALPLLAQAMRAVWQHRAGNTLTVASYERAGGVHDAVTAAAERVHGQLTPQQRHLAYHLLLRLVRVAEGVADGRHGMLRDDLIGTVGEGAETVLEAFVTARVLTADTDHVKFSHDALLRAWPRLRDWVNADRAGLRLRQRVIDAASAWDASGRSSSLLLCGPCLAPVAEWATESCCGSVLSPVEHAFLRASRDQQDESRQVDRWSCRRARLLAAGLAALTPVAVAGALVAARKANRRGSAGVQPACRALTRPRPPRPDIEQPLPRALSSASPVAASATVIPTSSDAFPRDRVGYQLVLVLIMRLPI